MIERIEHPGKLIYECSLPGEQRKDDVFPAHPNGIQLSKNRFLIVYVTRGYRGADDDLSIVAQLRSNGYDGPVISERFITRTRNDWEPFGDGVPYVLQNGHAAAFGVPKGALIKGRAAPQAGLFVIKWHYLARYLDPETGILISNRERPDIADATIRTAWVQMRLNDADDDLEIVAEPRQMREKGYETGAAFCSAPISHTNNTFTQAVPFNDECSEWIDFHHMHGKIAAHKYRYDADTRTYQWVQTGTLFGDGLSEASVARFGDDWVIAARPRVDPDSMGSPAGWIRTDDPFAGTAPIVRPSQPLIKAPLTAYMFPDGQLRLLTGDQTVSPYNFPRNPLYMWDIDPDRGFVASNRTVVFDTFEQGIPIPPDSLPRCDFGHVLPHSGGSQQVVAHRLLGSFLNDARARGKAISPEDKAPAGVYYDVIHFTEHYDCPWDFSQEDS